MDGSTGWSIRKHVRGLLLAVVTGVPAMLLCAAVLLGHAPQPEAQAIHYSAPPSAENGEKIYKGGCIACHGATGEGAAMEDTVFERRDTWPDFTKCAGTTPEPDGNWKAVITHGGPSRGLMQIMPAFGDLLTDAQINDVIAYLRTFCHNTHHDPRGELNLPRAIVTEKAFPEDEDIISTAANATGAPTYVSDVIDERTIFDARTQLETDVPINYADQNHKWSEGTGDITIGLKRELFSTSSQILSVQGGFLLPTGQNHLGFGSGTTQFEPFAAYDVLFHNNSFIQTELGADLPFDTSVAPRSMFYRAVLGQAFAADHLLGRLYAPMVEILGTRDFKPGAGNDLDILPEMQITVSRLQHVRVGVGYRQPFTNTTGRNPQVLLYLLWDRADGRIWEGWR